jgi:8-oxo-dGTP pyrophosphatase MutT (NUDIX family)
MSAPTHAGGIVVRRTTDGPEYLLVRTRSDSVEWVFPKGHIEAGETPAEAAVREVAEEAGVQSGSPTLVGVTEFEFRGEDVVTEYFMLAHLADGVPEEEGRDPRWCTSTEARELLSFEDLKGLLPPE